ELRHAGRDRHGDATKGVEALPIEPGRRRATAGQPIEHHVVEELIAADGVLGMAVVVGPRPELLEDPRGLARGGVDEAVADGLGSGALFLRIARIVILVVIELGQGPLLDVGVARSVRSWAGDWHVDVDAGAATAVLIFHKS